MTCAMNTINSGWRLASLRMFHTDKATGMKAGALQKSVSLSSTKTVSHRTLGLHRTQFEKQ